MKTAEKKQETKSGIETTTYILPAHWACPLINGDNSGLTDVEEKEIEKFHRCYMMPGHRFNCIECSDEQYFKWSNDANSIGGDVLEFTFDVSLIK